ncbi:MAG: undecaprenyldiphospho-muramoylpentapeptide beta-N-acetylglucosaminyltransferase [Thermodesulfovibrionales bacterium]|jgi:UDP-N-acetylglucosamine--N-acetylmuramyl-(pentapeptide) pyrophosphoryl-undecaprenol N-acetylglucosamine transferase
MAKIKAIIAGGGTGGHLYPGIAVAEELQHRYGLHKEDIVFVGTEHGIEARVLPREGYPVEFLKVEGMVGKSLLKKIKALVTFFLSIFRSRKIIMNVRPDIVIGVGGYASAGMVFAARLMGKPTMILEQNSVPGLSNRLLGKFVDAISVTYQESIASFPAEKTFLTGNPIRRNILFSDGEKARRVFPLQKGRLTVFIFGGSSGARSINNAIVDALHYLLDLRQNIQFLHQTGERDFEAVKDAYRKLGFNGIVVPFIYQMAEAYSIADIIVCRAGATTLSEITSLGKPAILIPYPYAAANHQEHNARKLQDMKAARLIPERGLTGESLAGTIRELYENAPLRREMQKAASAFGKVDASEKVADIAWSLMKREQK